MLQRDDPTAHVSVSPAGVAASGQGCAARARSLLRVVAAAEVQAERPPRVYASPVMAWLTG